MRNNVVSVWTDDRVETLKALWAEGLTGTQVAAKLGVTRNTILGKVYRLRIPPKDRRPTPKTLEEREMARKLREERSNELRRRRRQQFRLNNPIPDRPVRPLVCEAVEPRHVSLVDLGPSECRWPYGEGPYTFCGHNQFHGSYCVTHYFASVGQGTSSERAASSVSRKVDA